jgi:hypothetical protein
MPRRDSEEEDFTTLTKVSCNDRTCHASSDAEGTKDESDVDVEKDFDYSTGMLA